MTCPRYGTCKPSTCSCAKPFPVHVGEKLAAEQAQPWKPMVFTTALLISIAILAVYAAGYVGLSRQAKAIELEERV